MKYGWFIRGKRSRLFVRVSGSVLLAFERAADATMFPSAMAAQAAIKRMSLAPELEVVDMAVHDPIPPDADQTPVRTREQVTQDALTEDQPKEAQRRATWGLVEKAVAVVVCAAACLAAVALRPAAASPSRDNLFPPTIGASIAHDSLRAGYHRPLHRSRHGAHSRGFRARHVPGEGLSHDASNASAVTIAEQYLGRNPTGRASLWCADFANFVERQLGRAGTNSREALSFLRYGPHVNSPAPGDLVVLRRHGGGHVGYFINQTPRGPQIVSGNHGHAVGIGVYNPRNVIAYVRPS